MADVKQISFPNLRTKIEAEGGVTPQWAAWIRDMTDALNKGYDGDLEVTTAAGSKTLTFEHGILVGIA